MTPDETASRTASDSASDRAPETDADAGAGVDRPVRIADESELDDVVSNAAVALVEFYTDGCGICRSMEPVLGNLARELEATVGFVNPRNDPPLIDRFEVKSVPLFVLFVDGDPVARRAEGFIPGDDLAAWVRDHAGDGA
jgi:thioredoxin-like negative regulator of GroEL